MSKREAYQVALSMLGSIDAETVRDIASGKLDIPLYLIHVFEPSGETLDIFRSIAAEWTDPESPIHGVDNYFDSI